MCKETYWARYEVLGDVTNVIYYEDYKWNMVNGEDQYYCTVLLRDISLCNGKWKDVDGNLVDFEVELDVEVEESESSLLRTLGLILYVMVVCLF